MNRTEVLREECKVLREKLFVKVVAIAASITDKYPSECEERNSEFLKLAMEYGFKVQEIWDGLLFLERGEILDYGDCGGL